jgi:hypothetical protein
MKWASPEAYHGLGSPIGSHAKATPPVKTLVTVIVRMRVLNRSAFLKCIVRLTLRMSRAPSASSGVSAPFACQTTPDAI